MFAAHPCAPVVIAKPVIGALLLLSVLASAVASSTAAAELLTLSEAEAIALRDEPGRSRLAAHAAALLEQAGAAGQLPDPQLRAGLMNLPFESGDFRTEGMSQVQLGIRQAFPPGRTLKWRATQLERQAGVLESLSNGREREVVASVRFAWLDLYYWTRARDIVSENTPLFADLVEVTRALYAVGREDQQDLLHAELERSRLEDRLLTIDQAIGEARSALAQWLGAEAAQRPVGPSLPAWDEMPAFEEIASRLDTFPSLVAATGEIAVRDAGVSLAEQRYKPGFAVDIGYGYRDGRLPSGVSRSDFLSLMVSFDLPVFRQKRQDRVLTAARSERRASVHARTELHRTLLQQLQTAYARWKETNERLALYEDVILDQAASQSDAALKAYQSDTTDFADVMRALISELEISLDYHRLQVDRDRNYVVLAKLGGMQ